MKHSLEWHHVREHLKLLAIPSFDIFYWPIKGASQIACCCLISQVPRSISSHNANSLMAIKCDKCKDCDKIRWLKCVFPVKVFGFESLYIIFLATFRPVVCSIPIAGFRTDRIESAWIGLDYPISIFSSGVVTEIIFNIYSHLNVISNAHLVCASQNVCTPNTLACWKKKGTETSENKKPGTKNDAISRRSPLERRGAFNPKPLTLLKVWRAGN